MRVDDAYRKCVCFIGYEADGRKRVGASAFFVAFEPGSFLVLTARHVIEGIRAEAPQGTPVRLWINRPGGSLGCVDTAPDDWLFHPGDPAVDAAVLRQPVPSADLDHLAIQRGAFVTDEFIREHQVGIGDELFFPGLFVPHRGTDRVRPIMRQGTIAAAPEEPVTTGMGLMDAYLAEVRSIGGLSGSPVFLYLDFWRIPPGDHEEPIPEDPPSTMFMGLVHGHHDWRPRSGHPPDLEAVNMGISIILPSQRIREVIDQPAVEGMRNQAIDAAEIPVMDATFAGGEFRA